MFASTDPVVDELRSRTLGADATPSVALDSTSEIDVTAANALAGVVGDLQAAAVEVRFAAAHASVRDHVSRLGHAELAGLASPYPTVAAAVSGSQVEDQP